jgi:hypothetical protein
VHFDTALNSIWLALGILACARAVRATRRSTGSGSPESCYSAFNGFRVAGVVLLLAALLFPFISATDDVVRIEHLRGQSNHSSSSQRGPTDDLIRLYQTMDTPLVCAVLRVSLTLFFVLLIATSVVRRIDRSRPFESGRSPPRFLSASI